ncbi:MAG TPA: dynamin family protein [Pseudomonadota bacterium]|nr:dynamin family protein [Pseudomonadota bacterium]
MEDASRRELYRELCDRIAQDPELLLALHRGFPESFPAPASDPLRPLKTRLRQLAQRLQPLHERLVRLGYEISAAPLQKLIGDCETFAFRVFVVGEFSTGKSTLINALLGREYLPTGYEPVTLAPTRISYGPEPKLFVKAIGKLEQPVPDFSLLQELKLDSQELGTWGNSWGGSDIEYLRVEVPVPLLHNGLCLIDTPGLNDASQRGRLIADLLPEADAVILVTAANRLMTSQEQDLIRLAQGLPDAEQKRWLDVGLVAVTFADVVLKGQRTQAAIDKKLAPLKKRLDTLLTELHPPRGFAQGRRFFLDATQAIPPSQSQDEVSQALGSETVVQGFGRGEFERFLHSLGQFLALERGGVQEAQCRERALAQLKKAQDQLYDVLNGHYASQQLGIEEQTEIKRQIDRLRKQGKQLAETVESQVSKQIDKAKVDLREQLRTLLDGLDKHLSSKKNPHGTLTEPRAAADYFAHRGQAFMQKGLDSWVREDLIPQIEKALAPSYERLKTLTEEAEGIAKAEYLGLSSGLGSAVGDQAVDANVGFLVVAAGAGSIVGGGVGLGAALIFSLSMAVAVPVAAAVGLVLLLAAAAGLEVSTGEEYLRGLVVKEIREKVEAQLPAAVENLGQRLRQQLGNLPLAIETETERMAALLEEQLRQRQQDWSRSQEESAARIAEVAALRADIAAVIATL